MDLNTLARTPESEWPAGTGSYLLRILSDDSAATTERLAAAQLAANLTVIDDDLSDVLLSILDRGDFSDELRGQAALSLGPVLERSDIGAFSDPADVPVSKGTVRQIQAAFRKHFGDGGVPKDVRRRVLEASVRAPQDWHYDAIKSSYAHRDRDWKQTSVFAMRWVDGFEDSIVEALQSTDNAIRYEAVCAAGNWGIDAAWPYLEPMLSVEATDRHVLLAAIEAVASIRPKQAASALSELPADVVEAAQGALTLAAARRRRHSSQ